jgi:DNA polymerase elongation subunit (family B)
MYQIIDDRASGKTSRLFLLAKENNGIVVCRNPKGMRDKALAYGIVGIDFISYQDYPKIMATNKTQPVFIDELSSFWKYCDPHFSGYTESKEGHINESHIIG